MEKKKIILIGAGLRGTAYVQLMCDDKEERYQVVAVAEPEDSRRNYIKEKAGIPEEMCRKSWETLLAMPKFADAVIISTQDKDHYVQAMQAIEKGYDLLLEKPISPSPKECADIANAANAKGVNVLVCHVLRYSPFFRLIKKIITDGKIGDIINMQHTENVGHLHQSHSFVRGNWGNSERSACMILAKSCHDMDIIQWLMDKPCKSVHSFGSLSYFRRENAPDGAPERCIEGCAHADNCFYNAVKLYRDNEGASYRQWFREASSMKVNPTDEDMNRVLRETQYGKCVYKCDNDVVDHQVVNLEFEGGATASFSMCAFNEGGRYIRVMGTRGELVGRMEDDFVTVYDFETCKNVTYQIPEETSDQTINGGHGGGDAGIVNAFYPLLCGDLSNNALSSISVSSDNHLISFAAERSRVEGRVVTMNEVRSDYGLKL